jgi:YD repeat-containing protein
MNPILLLAEPSARSLCPPASQTRSAYDGYGRLASMSGYINGVWIALADGFLYQPATDTGYTWHHGNNRAGMVTLDTDGRVTQLARPEG